jgi:hypothetical protein
MFANWRDGFSKTRTVFRLLMNKEMGELSTFQATTVKATGIYVFYLCFLEAVAALGMVSMRGSRRRT